VRPLALPDPAHVDILEAYRAAKAAALEIQPEAELFGISGGAFVRGTRDLTKDRDSLDAGPAMPLLFQFEYAGDSTGKGDVKRHVEVRVARDGLHIATVDGGRESHGRSLPPLAEPTCSSRRAWATAVDSGVPEDVEATLLLHTEHDRLVWSLRVPNQPLHHRLIDARTCAVVARATVAGSQGQERARENSQP
jgi:hypothetical protein